MLEFALIGDGDGLEALVRMAAHAAFFVAGREFMGRGVVEQQEGAQLAAEIVVVEDGADGETVADPVQAGTLVEAEEFFHRVI